jgi:hypothetical protein
MSARALPRARARPAAAPPPAHVSTRRASPRAPRPRRVLVTPQKPPAGSQVELEYEAAVGTAHHDLNELLSSGVDKATIKKLCDANIRTVERVRMEPLKNLIAINGVSEAKAKKVREEACKFLGANRFITASEKLSVSKQQFVRARARRDPGPALTRRAIRPRAHAARDPLPRSPRPSPRRK